MYSVVACPRCRIARVVEPGRKTASCGSCGRSLVLADLRAQWSGASLDEARLALGHANARLSGRGAEFEAALIPPAPRADLPHEDAWHAAAAAARAARSEAARVDCVARALSAALGEFHEGDLERALHIAGIRTVKLDGHVARMLATSVLFQPRAGRYRAF